ncbi:putative metalloprotease [Saccharomonospora marina XMU15]|uniref:Putative metalloprotease n=1 Tax=Saccharomonospora marina XMU15 TaxID=882083 RepID=H5X0I0_9PSEU|nr:neutral zinc metallopeptidase [Saccharomonospora marina]EHR49705.1 putative metalloprotease [Saccharomonospora marina XMU15]
MDTAGDDAGRPASETRAGRPYIEDLPLTLWDAQDDPQQPRPRGADRSWRWALPVAAALLLVAALVLVVPTLDRANGDATTVSGAAARQAAAQPQDSALLTAGVSLGKVTCDLPPLGAGRPALRAYYLAQLRCLDAAWKPALDLAGVSFEPVRVRIVDEPRTACGALPPRDEATGLYCDKDMTIYLPRDRTLAAFGLAREAHVATLAHEYGHHVQHLSGILAAVNRRLATVEQDSPQDKELGRRVELQANCFAGLFLGSAAGSGAVSVDLAEAAVDDFRNWVDSETHGSSRTQRRWAMRGYHGETVSACDTWQAGRDQIE